MKSDEPADGDNDEGTKVSKDVHVESEGVVCDSPVSGGDDHDSPPPPVPPPKPSSTLNLGNMRYVLGNFGALRIGPTRRGGGSRSLVSARSSPTGSHPSSPRSHSENEGYNSSDEHMPCYGPSHPVSGLFLSHRKENTSLKQRLDNQLALRLDNNLHNYLRKECRSDMFLPEENVLDDSGVDEMDYDENEMDEEGHGTQEQQRIIANNWRASISANM